MKELALAVLKGAVTLFPPLASLISDALTSHDANITDPNDPQASLANDVRAILPERSAIHDAVETLEKRNAQR